jgi:hypothetical protein
MPDARSERPPYLYHYQPFNEKWLRGLLSDYKIHCSNPAGFNDPWDSKPWFNTDCYEDAKERKRLEQYFKRVRNQLGLSSSAFRPHQAETTCSDVVQARVAVATLSGVLQRSISRHYRVFCLSPRNDINLMWSHYARSHQGICLEFSTKNPVFCTAQKVEYYTTFPHLRIEDGDDEALQFLLTKSTDWNYECEYRLVAGVGEDPPPHAGGLLVTRQDCLEFPRGALSSVIAGSQADVEAIRVVIEDFSPTVQLKRAVRRHNEYRLEII